MPHRQCSCSHGKGLRCSRAVAQGMQQGPQLQSCSTIPGQIHPPELIPPRRLHALALLLRGWTATCIANPDGTEMGLRSCSVQNTCVVFGFVFFLCATQLSVKVLTACVMAKTSQPEPCSERSLDASSFCPWGESGSVLSRIW